jgi:hypothetical protein
MDIPGLHVLPDVIEFPGGAPLANLTLPLVDTERSAVRVNPTVCNVRGILGLRAETNVHFADRAGRRLRADGVGSMPDRLCVADETYGDAPPQRGRSPILPRSRIHAGTTTSPYGARVRPRQRSIVDSQHRDGLRRQRRPVRSDRHEHRGRRAVRRPDMRRCCRRALSASR